MKVERNPERYKEHVLKEKFETIRREFAKYKEVKLIGLSMKDM